jgi:chromosome segregation protein
LFKLKKVELLGFKSFADRTRLEFADGIAAIVGPNGCGKSNLSDAISWVLGEQSAKSLRGQRMSDVIFNGTSARPATGMSEVSLTLIDPESLMADGGAGAEVIPSEPLLEASTEATGENDNGAGANGDARPAALRHRAGEITVTRRLFRSGESEYLINGELCRLRDIQDLFMGTGLGPESYAIIEQGRIGQILSSKPSDRRAIIEEAAGVSKFKTRKRLAEAKLESSRQNLARITDILEEVTKRVNSLKRQASKARRYRELQDELRGKLKVVLTSRLAALEEDMARVRTELAAAQAAVAEAGAQLEQLEGEYRGIEERHDELEVSLTALRESLARGELERERVQSRIEQMRQHMATLEARGAEALQERSLLAAQLEGLETEAVERGRAREQLRQDWEAAQQSARGLLARQESLAVQLTAAEKEGEETRQAVLDAVSRAAELRNQLVQAEETALALERQASRLSAERAATEQEQAKRSAELEGITSEHARGESSLAEAARAAAETALALEKARAESSAKRNEVESLRQEFSAASARRQALEETLARHAYSTDAVRRLLSGGAGNGRSFRPLGVLADFLEVAPGYEEVVEEFLHDELDCVVVERHEEARSGIALLRSEGTGRSTFFVKRVATKRHSHGPANGKPAGEPGVLTPLRDLVKFEPRLERRPADSFPRGRLRGRERGSRRAPGGRISGLPFPDHLGRPLPPPAGEGRQGFERRAARPAARLSRARAADRGIAVLAARGRRLPERCGIPRRAPRYGAARP